MKTINLCYFAGESTAPAPAITAEAGSAPAAPGVGTREAFETESAHQPAPAASEGADKGSAQEQTDYKQFKEQFKDLYQADLQRVIDKRFKNAKKVEAERDALKSESEHFAPLLSALEQRYGTRDLEQLQSRIADHSPAPQQAEAENENESRQETAAAGEEAPAPEAPEQEAALQQIVEQWQREAQELGTLYPSFSLDKEVENEKFSLALQSGMSVRDAYQFAHFDEILGGVIAYTAQDVKQRLAAGRSARSARPAENGTRGGAAAVVKSDVSKLSKKDMEEIDKRVLRGERISF